VPLSPVSIATDLALPLIPLVMTFHDLIPVPPVPPVPPPGIYPCIEIPVLMMWPPGYGLQQNKLTTTVLHKFMPLALDGHDCGYMIPHITIPANNALLPMHIMFSSRKFVFSASTVKANGTPVGCTWPLMPMMCCAQPVTLPSGTALLNCLNTVYVGVTWMDVLMGVVSIVITIVGDALTYGGPSGSAMDYAWKFILGDSPKNWLIKTGLGVVGGAIRIAATGEGSIQIGVGSGYAGGNVGLSRGSDGSWSVSATGSGGVPLGPGAVGGQASAQHTWNPDGTSSTTTSTTVSGAAGGPVAAAGGSHTSSSTTNYNQDGSVASDTTTTTDSTVAGTPLGGNSTGSSTTTNNMPGAGTSPDSGSGGSPASSGSGGSSPPGGAGAGSASGSGGSPGGGASGAGGSGGNPASGAGGAGSSGGGSPASSGSGGNSPPSGAGGAGSSGGGSPGGAAGGAGGGNSGNGGFPGGGGSSGGGGASDDWGDAL
jgi:hypothetical protein